VQNYVKIEEWVLGKRRVGSVSTPSNNRWLKMAKQIATLDECALKVTVANLCSAAGYGDYEIMPVEKLDLDMFRLADLFTASGYRLIGCNNEVCLFSIDQVDITLFKDGRTIMEKVLPDKHDKALTYAEKIYKASEFV
jgi:hypothetical protein